MGTTPEEMFSEFRALMNINLFNILIDTLESEYYINNLTTPIKVLINQINEDIDKKGYTDHAKLFKLICELGLATDMLRDMIAFAAYQGVLYEKDTDRAIHWIIEFARIIDPKKIPNLAREIEKIGFERS